MTTTEKVRLVDQHRKERGLNRCLRAIDLPKSTYYYRQKRSDEPSEEELKPNGPFSLHGFLPLQLILVVQSRTQ